MRSARYHPPEEARAASAPCGVVLRRTAACPPARQEGLDAPGRREGAGQAWRRLAQAGGAMEELVEVRQRAARAIEGKGQVWWDPPAA